jgi:hypothetical protein
VKVTYFCGILRVFLQEKNNNLPVKMHAIFCAQKGRILLFLSSQVQNIIEQIAFQIGYYVTDGVTGEDANYYQEQGKLSSALQKIIRKHENLVTICTVIQS